MPSDDLNARLRHSPVTVECPICRHRQRVAAAEERCDQCGSEITLFESREAGRRVLEASLDDGRVAYLRDIPGGLFVVIANRSFRKRDA